MPRPAPSPKHRGDTSARSKSHSVPLSIIDGLRAQIISLKRPPGSVLSRTELQETYGLSSTPIRDALIRLQEEGLVDIFPQRATLVSLIDIPKAEQAQFLRRSVEQEAVRILASQSDAGLVTRLRAIIAQQKAFATARNLDGFDTSDLVFHKLMVDAAGAPDLWHLVRRHSGHSDRIRRLNLPVSGKMAQVVHDHLEIVSAIADGKPASAQRALRDHLSRSIAHWSDMRAAYPGYFRD
jgi:GntR family transcriptional regulator, rspAB operon transcriptional repressor